MASNLTGVTGDESSPPQANPQSHNSELSLITESKYLDSVISSLEYIRLYLAQPENRLLIVTRGKNIHCFNLDSLSSTPSATFSWTESSIKIGGSCNGVLPVSYRFSTVLPFVLLNPSTRTYIHVPSQSGTLIKGNVGLGFDNRSNNYKAVLVTQNDDVRVTSAYSLKSESWKVVDQTKSSDSMEQRFGGVLVGNHLLHWMFFTRPDYRQRFACFDVISENWTEDILMPRHHYHPTSQSYFMDFGVVDGCLFSTFENQVNGCYDVWVMKEYGVQDSWTRLLSVPISEEMNTVVVPVASRGLGSKEVLLWQLHMLNKALKQFWYIWKDHKLNKVEIPNYGFYGIPPYICKAIVVSLPGDRLFGEVFDELINLLKTLSNLFDRLF